MKKSLLLMATVLGMSGHVYADTIQPSETLPGEGRPEHVYTMMNGNNVYANSLTAPTQTEENFGQFAFYAVEGKTNAYYIYSHKAEKWLTYTQSSSYNNGKDFVKMADEKADDAYFLVTNYSGDKYEIQPYTTSGTNDKYLNWYQGVSGNPLDGTNTLGLWQDSGSADNGSNYTFTEVVYIVRTYTIVLPEGVTIKIGDSVYQNGDTYTVEGSVKRSDISVSVNAGQFAAISIDDVACTISVYVATIPTQPTTATYTQAQVYPLQQTEVGAAKLEVADDVYTLSNNVLAASFMKLGNAIYFAGSEAMDLVAGTEPFTVAFGSGDNVAASSMTLKSVTVQDLEANPAAIGGVEHYVGKAIVANYEYTYKETTLNIVWRAVLRDGSHYLRTEMDLTGVDDVDMYDVIPMIYNVDTKAACSVPATVGNTRGAVIMSDKIFAGLETPTAYNTVGEASGDEDNWTLAEALSPISLQATSWVQLAEAEVPYRVTEVTGATTSQVYAYEHTGVVLKQNQKIEVKIDYVSGANRLNFGGVDLLSGSGEVAANDYHSGYSGTAADKNTFTFTVPFDGTFTVRAMVENKTEPISASSTMTIKIYDPKDGIVVNTDVVGIQGRWSRNTTLAAGETWKVASVVGLIAQDGTQSDANIHKSQKRRSFLAYSERERAVPWRANPVYISWYELNINRNNAAPGNEPSNMVADQVIDVLEHWKSDMYDRYGVAANMFVIDDGWDTYGEWQFHSGFPNEMRDIAALAKEMNGAGVGAWLGPVGGYGQSGNYRRQYWSDKGGMVLGNPAYYESFKAAATNLVQNQGDNYTFFKFDGISGQFSATGPDAGDSGNENAEGIIRLERFVREELREDIFFNTTVGTWASPFWYQITDATWRQENDHDHIGNNSNSRENWITYRDRLVYQNYVTNSPICPINTLMTHGFILSVYGGPANDSRDYASVRRELRCAFVCGSGMVELYNDYALMNSINGGALWADLAECISWQKRNADVLPDAHWVGGNPWNGSTTDIYGWAAWNGTKSTLALRNGGNSAKSYTFTLRDALNIPANVSGSIILRSSFGDQDALEGLTEGEAINIDTQLTVNLPGSSVYAFDGIDATTTVTPVQTITLTTETGEATVAAEKTLVVNAAVNPAAASFPILKWSSSNPAVATVYAGLVKAVAEGEVTITATATDGSGVSASVTLTVTEKEPEEEKEKEPYATNFDKDTNATRTDRYITSITFTETGAEEQVIGVNQAKPYIDKTADEDCILTCTEGSTVKAQISMAGSWMNGYVYIDLDNDQQFSFNDGQTDQSGTDVMSFSFYTGKFDDDSNGVNSAGQTIEGVARNTLECPSFVAPVAGTYRIRFKMDWNSIDAGGQIAADGTCSGANGILANGGSIVDATLVVTETSGIKNVELTEGDTVIYDLMGRKVVGTPAKGIYIKNGQKVRF